MDYTERLRSLAINEALAAGDHTGVEILPEELDRKTLALVRLAALVAVGGPGPSYGAETDAAVTAGATAVEIVDVLVGVASVVGVPRVVAAAPNVAMALGYDTDAAFESECGG